MTPPLDPGVARLLEALADLTMFLTERSQSRWADWVSGDAALIRAGDGRGIDHFLSALGVMGSLSDLLFSPANGNAAGEQEADDLNARFRHLVQTAWTQAEAIRRSEGA